MSKYKLFFLTIFTILGGLALLFLVGSAFLGQITRGPEEFILEKRKLEEIKENIPAPDFGLEDLLGKSQKLSDFQGKIAVLSFWASWNKTSQDQLVILESFFKKQKSDKFAIFPINSQEPKILVLSFVRRGGYEIPVFLDEDGEISEVFQVKFLPTTFFIDQGGIIREIYVGVLSEAKLREKIEKLYQ